MSVCRVRNKQSSLSSLLSCCHGAVLAVLKRILGKQVQVLRTVFSVSIFFVWFGCEIVAKPSYIPPCVL